jgi:REP element-mobilizing transposase RayT
MAMSGFGNRQTRPFEPPMPDPLAFFLTWTTYGSWLPGDERGWVHRGQGIQIPDPVRQERAASLLTEPPCSLDREQRAVVEATIRKHCEVRGWQLHAVNCRTCHVHVVVSANRAPKEVREQFKAWCTRKLKELDRERSRTLARRASEGTSDRRPAIEGDAATRPLRENWWTERGSIRWIGDDASLEAAIIYVRDAQ